MGGGACLAIITTLSPKTVSQDAPDIEQKLHRCNFFFQTSTPGQTELQHWQTEGSSRQIGLGGVATLA